MAVQDIAAAPSVRAEDERVCPACQGRSRRPLGIERAPWRIVACGDCGFIYTSPAPTYAALAGDLSWDKSFVQHAQAKKNERPVVDWLDRTTRWRLRLLPRTSFAAHIARQAPPGPVLDVGCGWGEHFMALDEVYTPYGVEIAPVLAEAAGERAASRGGMVECAPALEGLKRFPDGFFAGAMLRSYIEHELEPKAVLAELARVLRADGAAIVKAPNWATLNRMVMGRNWCGVRLPDHVNYFTPKSLRAMAADVGLTARFGVGGQFPTNDNFYAVLRPL